MTLEYSRAAEHDLAHIALYTVEHWGVDQADRYLAQLEDRCQSLTRNTLVGRPCDWLVQDLRRVEDGSHVIFYLPDKDRIFIVRILHQSMSPAKHDFSV